MKSAAAMAGRPSVLLAACVASLLGCARTIYVTPQPASAVIERPHPHFVELPIIQVRQYPQSPIVTIVAWNPFEAMYGLASHVRRDGQLVRDHRLYISTYYLGYNTFNVNRGRTDVVQTVVPSDQLLVSTGVSRDYYNCFYGRDCSPFETRGVRVPDELLRSNRDSVSVRIYGRGGAESIVTLRRDVIDPYLAAFDSVTASLRKK